MTDLRAHEISLLDDDLPTQTRRDAEPLAGLHSDSDPALVARAQAGEREAFDELHRRYAGAVEEVCRKRLDERDVKDAVQAVFLKAWRALPHFKGGDLVGHWLRRIAKNHCLDELGKRRVECPLDATVAAVPYAAAERDVTACIERITVEMLLGKLQPRDAALLRARYLDDAPVAVIASQFGLTVASTEVALHRARRGARCIWLDNLQAVFAFPPLRRLCDALQTRLAPYDILAVAGNTVCHVVVALALTVPQLVGGQPAASPLPAESLVAPKPPAEASLLAPPARVRDLPAHGAPPAAARAHQGQAEAPDAGWAPEPRKNSGPNRAVQFSPIPVPGTDRQVQQERPEGSADYKVGARARVGGHESDLYVESFDEQENDDLNEAACTVARVGAPVTYCES